MRVRYFIFDGDSTFLARIAQGRVEGAWEGRKPWDAAGGTRDLRIVTVLSDDELKPEKAFHTRVQVLDGWIHRASVLEAVSAWAGLRPQPGQPDGNAGAENQPEVIYQFSGWPPAAEIYRQLAVALDVPFGNLPSLGFGGPLLASCLLDVSVKRAHSYFA